MTKPARQTIQEQPAPNLRTTVIPGHADSSTSRQTVLQPGSEAPSDGARETVLEAHSAPPPVTDLPRLPARASVFCSMVRPPVPRLTAIDDGEPESGEVHRLRTPRVTLGRAGADILIPHDPDMSAVHAEIVRQDQDGGHAWLLLDLSSTNGTFVRIRRSVLRHKSQLYLGGRRFVFHCPDSVGCGDSAERPEVRTTHNQADPPGAGPPLPPAQLVEQTTEGTGACYVLQGDQPMLGRDPNRCGIHWDDPFLDDQHARFSQDKRQRWWIFDEGSVNGIWIRTGKKVLDTGTEFRLGGQRFRFDLPPQRQAAS